MARVDFVLVEGFHTHGHPAIEVFRPHEAHALMWREGSSIVAVASDEPLPEVTVPVLDLNDVVAIATLALANADSDRYAMRPHPACPAIAGSAPEHRAEKYCPHQIPHGPVARLNTTEQTNSA